MGPDRKLHASQERCKVPTAVEENSSLTQPDVRDSQKKVKGLLLHLYANVETQGAVGIVHWSD